MNLTALAYVVAVAVTLIGIIGQWQADPWPDLWRVPAASLLIGLLLECVVARRRGLRISPRIPERVMLGQPTAAELVLGNDGERPLQVELQQVFANGLSGSDAIAACTLPAHGRVVHPFSFSAQKLGALEWHRVYTRSRGVFGLAWWSRKFDVPHRLKVVPARLRGAERGPGTRPQGERVQRNAGAGFELLGLRDYRPGDPVRTIDWKATARSQRYTVRLHSEERNLELLVLLDAGRTSNLQAGMLSRLHHYVNVAARLAERAILNGDHVGMVVFADRPLAAVPPAHGAAALLGVRRILEQAHSVTSESNPLAAALLARRLLHHRSLVVLLTDVDESQDPAQLIRAVQLLAPKHLPVIAGTLDDETLALRHQPSRHWLHPYQAFAAAEMLLSVRGMTLRLRRSGAQAITTVPAQLDRAVLRSYEALRLQRQI
ncbi:MAG TPA: DUF58 domain-containing protein [Burkholderiales bacterium]|nr:DUF58 domain-containing protein [Burkholderiales bacterium]